MIKVTEDIVNEKEISKPEIFTPERYLKLISALDELPQNFLKSKCFTGTIDGMPALDVVLDKEYLPKE